MVNLYRRDLQESWLLASDGLERHKQSRRFQSRLAELQLAWWCQVNNLEIRGLEALGANVDIVVRRSSGEVCAIEVKRIGLEDSAFQARVEALQNRGGGWSPGNLADYVQLRVFESAIQLAGDERCRIAAVVLDRDIVRSAGGPSLDSIDWRRPTFTGADSDRINFLEKQKRKYPELNENWTDVVTSLQEVWLLLEEPEHSIKMLKAVRIDGRAN